MVTGGVQPYTYLWSDFTTNDTIANISVGKYYILVTDANGCTLTDSIEVFEPDEILINFVVIDSISCSGNADASVVVQPNSGNAPYSYEWNTGTTNDTLVDVGSGWYTVTITDATSCTAIDSVEITNPDLLAAELSLLSNVSCFGSSEGSAEVIISGGLEPCILLE